MAPHDFLLDAFALVARFRASDLKGRLAQLENAGTGRDREALRRLLGQEQVSDELLRAAVNVKRAAVQIDEVVHATGMLLCLPAVLDDDEIIETLSLGAGNTGKHFDLQTDRRIAGFTFIDWKGGSESIRKQKLFKDFYAFAEVTTHKPRYLYFLGEVYAPRVFRSKSHCRGMLRKYADLRDEFLRQYDPSLSVSEYYEKKKHLVVLQDLTAVAHTAAQAFARGAAATA